MELLLNEKSLEGQFADIEEFYDTLPDMIRNLKILRERNIILYKHSSLYSKKITDTMTLFDLQNSKGNIVPRYRDQVRQWKSELSKLTNEPPFWNVEEQNAEDSVLEAARRDTDVISFKHAKYQDVELPVFVEGKDKVVCSAVSTRYFLDILRERKEIDTLYFLRKRYAGKRLRLEMLDKETESVRYLQKAEIDELVTALDRFEAMDSWNDICKDNFFYYKSYKPASKKEDYFAQTCFADKTIDKFRCGKHSQIRCFGYREDEVFYVLMIERDHSVSDTG